MKKTFILAILTVLLIFCSFGLLACNGGEGSKEEPSTHTHVYDSGAITKAPTCTEKGIKTFTCVKGDDSYTEEIAALGHDLIHYEAKAATCTEIGWNAYDTCSRCDYTTYEEIAALGHEYVDGVCTRCGSKEEPSTHTHVYDSGVITKNATCTEKGVKTFTCVNGDDSYTEEIAALGHEYVDGVCTRCGEEPEATEGLVFTLNGKGTEYSVTGYNGTSTEVYIPSKYNDKPVTSIGVGAFEYCRGLTSITIGDSVTSIGRGAFFNCYKLVEVYNKSSLDITVGSLNNGYVGYYAKAVYTEPYTSKLSTDKNGYIIYMDGGDKILVGYTGKETELTLPADITEIYQYAFYECRGLTSVTIPNSVTSIGRAAFRECTGLTSITIPDSVTSIGGGAFEYCVGLTSVTIGNSVTSIGSLAFDGCYKLVEVYNKSSLNITAGYSNNGYVGWYAENIYTPNSGTSKLSTDKNGYIIYTDGGDKILIGYTGKETELTLPADITEINQHAFYSCSGLTSVTIGGSVKSIGGWAFEYCSGLTSITIPDSVKSIRGWAFGGCSGLTSVTIPNSVTSIGKNAFEYCSSLTSITIPDSVTSIGDMAFYNCSGLTSVTIPNSVTSIGGEAFEYCVGLTSVTIPDSVTSIGGGAFEYCVGLTSVIWKATNCTTAGSSGNWIFSNCSNLTTIIIDDNVQTIPSSAFSGCSGLTSVTIGNSVTSIGYGAFSGCSGLTSVTIPDSVTSIGYAAFSGCSGLKSVTIPNSVTNIEESAFYDCSGLKSVTIPNSVTSIGRAAFRECTGLTSVTIPDSVTSIGDYAFYGCNNLNYNEYDNAYYLGNDNNKYVVLIKAKNTSITSCVINENTKVIYGSAFENCSSLTSITIPDSVTSIENSAFRSCSGLTSITFKGTKAQWNAISKDGWKYKVPATVVNCTDGDVKI